MFADNVRKRADEKGLSLNMLADLAGIARSPLYRVLSCESSVTLDRLCKLANALECNPSDLLQEQ